MFIVFAHQWLNYRATPGEMEELCGLVLKEKGERVLLSSGGSNVNFEINFEIEMKG